MVRFFILIFSIAFLGIGYYFRTKRTKDNIPPHHLPLSLGPLLSAVGWVLFGLYWILHAPDFLEEEDVTNAFLCLAALPFFGYIALNEWKNSPIGGIEGLRFLSGIAIITMIGYTLVSYIPAVEGALEYVNAYLVAAFLSFFGFPAEAGAIDFSGNPLWHRTNDLIISVPVYHNGHDEIHITLSCTAFPSILLFSAAIVSARECFVTKARVFMLTVPVIFVFNIIRMVIVVHLTYGGITSAGFAHHVLGKAGSLLALIFLAWVLFTFLPSVLRSVGEVIEVFFGPPRGMRKPDKWKPK